MLHRWIVGLAVIGCLAVTGCASTTVLTRPGLPERIPSARVLLMEPDVELSLITAGGLAEPNAQWTEQGNRNVNAALTDVLRESNLHLVRYRAPGQDSDRAHGHHQLIKLYNAVGVTILQHMYGGPGRLPTKSDRFEWTLGASTVQGLREEYDADYALFVYLHDSYASAGRIGVMFVAAAFGVGIHGGIQVGFSSLVDLKTGNVVWFNRLVSTTGDLRTPRPARAAVQSLLSDLPLL